jgi:D-serine deaminase-like pyridoxal phosphate-dependent protein
MLSLVPSKAFARRRYCGEKPVRIRPESKTHNSEEVQIQAALKYLHMLTLKSSFTTF